jgi:transcriptional regulator with XRE-family HTH domain
MDAGARIKELRERAEIKQDELGKRLNKSRQAIDALESRSNLSTDAISEICSGLGISLAEFFESSIPLDFARKDDRGYHDKLAYLLEEDDFWSQGIQANIQAMEPKARAERKKRSRDKPKVAGA